MLGMGWTPKVAIKITNNEDEAIMNIDQDSPYIKVFMDGSGIDSSIGSVEILYRNRRVKAEL